MADGEYENRVVAFLDILGFSALASQADDAELRDRIVGGLTIMRSSLPTRTLQPGDLDFRSTQFSDCIVISARALSPFSVELILIAVATLATSLLEHGLLLRGGVAIGNMIHADEMLFGPALIAAHGMDRTGAPPRIGLTDDVVRLTGAQLSTMKALVRIDPYDLEPTLDHLAQYRMHGGGTGIGPLVTAGEAERIAKLIAAECYSGEHVPAVRAKWLWLERYWNEAVGVLGILPTTERFKEGLPLA
jgi:hypothetical protein